MRALDSRGPPLQNAGSCSGCPASPRGLLSHRGDELMSPGLHSKPANQKPGLWGSPPPGKAGPPESTAGDGGGEREPDFHFQGKRCTPHVHVQPEASIPDPRHPCVSRVAAPGSGGWALGLRHYPPAVRPGPSPPPGPRFLHLQIEEHPPAWPSQPSGPAHSDSWAPTRFLKLQGG